MGVPVADDDRPTRGMGICDKPTTVAVSRLLPDKRGIMRMPEDEFHALLALVLAWLPKVPA